MPAVAVMLASAMRGAENVRRFEHVFVITGVNARSSTSMSIAGTLPSGLRALLLERTRSGPRGDQVCLPRHELAAGVRGLTVLAETEWSGASALAGRGRTCLLKGTGSLPIRGGPNALGF